MGKKTYRNQGKEPDDNKIEVLGVTDIL